MSVWQVAVVCPVNVMTNGIISDPVDSAFNDAAAGGLKTEKKTGPSPLLRRRRKDEDDAKATISCEPSNESSR